MARETVDGESDVSEKAEKRDRLRDLLRLGTTCSVAASAAARVNLAGSARAFSGLDSANRFGTLLESPRRLE